ncbi:hypothetical protein Salat_1278100 [Sesamum alatum]|uniref:Uncharacterized protein n=1 Tax=Sesamum alatum TaxID=300844 RepID=A0AAE1YGC4_9LAMI|nr:hypothetical protein Salat_1278100 [Sesamum alatum]
MERKRNVKNHDSHVQQQRHRALDAYELYELEHMPRTLQMKVPSIDCGKPSREDDTFKPLYYETGRMVQNTWSQVKDGYHVHQRHRPRDAYELYELEHMPRTLNLHVKVSSKETGRTVQNSWSQTKDGGGGSYKGNIDADAETFIRLRHEKFELIWMSMNG